MSRLAFFGTPELAATCLGGLHLAAVAGGHDVVMVVCQPDKPVGRGHKVEAPPTKRLAQELGIEVRQPKTLKKDTDDGEAFFAEFSGLRLDLAIVAAYGRIMPQRVLDVPQVGCVNVHGSLLPRWRGAAPIQRAIEAGDAQTGVGLMHMVKALDAGDVYVEETLEILDDDTSITLTGRVADLGASMLEKHLEALLEGTLTRTPQREEGLTYAEMLKKEDGLADFNRSARDVYNRARAFVPWPGSQVVVDGETIKLFDPVITDVDTTGVVPGTLVDVNETWGAVFACQDRGIGFARVQRPSQGPKPASHWRRGLG